MAIVLSDTDLVGRAAALLNPRQVGGRLFGDVACALMTDRGNQFGGVCIDTPCGTGFCAEHAAIAAMVTAGEYRIQRIVAVWRDDDARLYLLPPCGRCREFMRQIDPENLSAEVLLGRGRRSALRELLPRSEWPEPY